MKRIPLLGESQGGIEIGLMVSPVVAVGLELLTPDVQALETDGYIYTMPSVRHGVREDDEISMRAATVRGRRNVRPSALFG